MKKNTVTVLGAGAWGITLGNILHQKGHRVRFWDASPNYCRGLDKKRENKKSLPGFKIPRSIPISHDMTAMTDKAEVLLIVSPSHVIRSVARRVKRIGIKPRLIVIATKGIEGKSLKRMSEVVAEELGGARNLPLVSLSGPSHAEEVSMKVPTAVVCAARQTAAAQWAQSLFMTRYFRIYTNRDQVGVELCGSLKNVIALAAGICDGLKLGDNTKGALMTRGLAEITRLGVMLGARAETFSGLAGIGDLITTCASQYSRNRYVGEQIGKGKKLKTVLRNMVEVAEGVRTTMAAYRLHTIYKVEMPITREIYKVLYKNKKPVKAVQDLMTRIAKPEF